MKDMIELIKKLCPEDVSYHELSELAEIGTGNSDRKDAVEDGKFPFYVRSKDVLRIDKYEYEEEAIVIPGEGGIGEIFHYVSGKYALHQRAYRIHVTSNSLDTKYLYYYMFAFFKEFILKKAVNATVTSIRKPMIEQFLVAVPPINIQRAIVQILETFDGIISELEYECDCRKKQFAEVAYRLLISNQKGSMHRLDNICNLSKGKTAIQKANPGEYPLVVTTSERKSSDEFQFDEPAVCIPLVSSRGHGVACLNHVYYQEGKFALGNILCAVTSKDMSVLSPRYLYYYFECTKDYTLVPLMKGGANVSMTVADISKIKIPVPSIEEQKEIIEKLEVFDEYCNEQILREIELRKKQYAYYREKLLTFSA